jgi:hypothetical protein
MPLLYQLSMSDEREVNTIKELCKKHRLLIS